MDAELNDAGSQPDEPQPDERVDATAQAMRPVTGDRVVDEALASFDAAATEDPAAQLAAATEAHRLLQARLTTPTPAEPAPPGQARPGPPR